MALASKCHLAAHIIREQLGGSVEAAATLLLQRGRSNFHDLLADWSQGTTDKQKRAERKQELQHALKVLVQFNYVSCYLMGGAEAVVLGQAKRYMYEANLQAMLYTLRFPRMLAHIRDEVVSADPEESEDRQELNESIISAIMANGRMNLEQIQARVWASLNQSPSASPGSVRSAVVGLINQRFIERAPGCDLPPPPAKQFRRDRARKGPAKPGSAAEAEQQAEQTRLLAKAEQERERFRIPAGILRPDADAPAAEVKPEADGEPARKKARTSKQAGGSKRKAAAAAEPAAALPQLSNPDVIVLWRINCEEFDRRFRHQECVEVVSARNGPDQGAVVAAMLYGTRHFESGPRPEHSAALSLDDVIKHVDSMVDIGLLEDRPDELPGLLSELADDECGIIDYEGEGPSGSCYSVNLRAIMEIQQQINLFAVIRARFGEEAMRMFRMLHHTPQEQKTIATRAMVEPKDARALLYRMLRGGFISMQSIPRTADHAPSRTIYTWRASIKDAAEHLAGELYKAALNVRLLMEHLLESNQQLLMTMQSESTTQKERDHGREIYKRYQILTGRLLQLDQDIALHSCF